MQSPARSLPYYQRGCLLVRDLDRSLPVYRDLLGFRLDYVAEDTPESFSYEVFRIPKDITTRFATLSSVDQQRTLALIEIPADEWFDRRIPMAASVVHVGNVGQTVNRARELGLETSRVQREDAPQNGPGRVEAALYDPDGHTIVIYQLL